jgi:hypothetical protein
MITLPFTTRGAPVIVYGWPFSMVCVSRHGFAGRAIEGDETPVDDADEDLVAPYRDAAVHDIAAGDAEGLLAIGLWIVLPQLLAAPGVDRIHDAPGAVVYITPSTTMRRRLDTAVGVEIHVPGEFQIPDVVRVDLRQRTVALFMVVASVTQPVVRLGLRIAQAFIGDLGEAGTRKQGKGGGERQRQ